MNFNKTMLGCRLTMDPTPIMVAGVTRGARLNVAVTNRVFSKTTQQYEDEPMFISCTVWNRGENNPQGRRQERT